MYFASREFDLNGDLDLNERHPRTFLYHWTNSSADAGALLVVLSRTAKQCDGRVGAVEARGRDFWRVIVKSRLPADQVRFWRG